jgi:hypothetical protein
MKHILVLLATLFVGNLCYGQTFTIINTTNRSIEYSVMASAQGKDCYSSAKLTLPAGNTVYYDNASFKVIKWACAETPTVWKGFGTSHAKMVTSAQPTRKDASYVWVEDKNHNITVTIK